MFLKFDLFFSNFLFRVLCVCISWHDIALKNYIENRAQLTHLVGYVCVRLSVCVCVHVKQSNFLTTNKKQSQLSHNKNDRSNSKIKKCEN